MESIDNKPRINLLRSALLEISHSNECRNIIQNNKASDKSCRKHPKLVKLLDILRQVSPQRLVSDSEQPLSGSIAEILQHRLASPKKVSSQSCDASPNIQFRILNAKIEVNKSSVLLNLCKNDRYKIRAVDSSK